jgi:hypothetical protein
MGKTYRVELAILQVGGKRLQLTENSNTRPKSQTETQFIEKGQRPKKAAVVNAKTNRRWPDQSLDSRQQLTS